jgi:2,4-dienoyl-CoA reductase-like NADH-dependent reductase (Old Yellow Enzyme family)
MAPMPVSTHALFEPFRLRNLLLPNRLVMAPMTRAKSPGGVPGANVAAYYRRRAEGGTGLLITEGTWIPHPTAGSMPDVPRFHGEDALAGWREVARAVHAAHGRIFPQLWHTGIAASRNAPAGFVTASPSGLWLPGEKRGEPMSREEIAAVVAAYGVAARSAKELGFDGVELHGAHGYLIDQFLWDGTNQRTDEYGGDLAARTRFAVEVIREVRRQVGPEFPLALRFSQWKMQDYAAKLARTAQELDTLLQPLAAAGVDIFHCSTRRFWEPEFPGSRLNLAGWTKKLTGKPTITVGSVTLNEEFTTTFRTDEGAAITGIDELIERLERGEFDLVAVGRSLIVNPDWPLLVRRGAIDALKPFQRDVLKELV